MPRKWILVVDDDPAILAIIADAIEHPALSVTTAGDALQAFIQARDLKPVVIVSDIQMPGFGDGTSIVKKLREDKYFLNVPIIFMTGMEPSKARELMPKNDPMIGLMSKPVNLDVLRGYIWKAAGILPASAPPGGAP